MSTNEKQTELQTLLKRADLLLEDGNWNSATQYYEKVLDIEPESAKAYIGLLLSSLKISSEKDLECSNVGFDNNKLYQRALQFADTEYKEVLMQYAAENTYFRATSIIKKATHKKDYVLAISILQKITDYKDSENLIEQCEKAIVAEETAKEKKKKKILAAIGAIIGVIGLLVILWSSTTTAANNKKAEKIYNNFLGQTFSGRSKSDDNFLNDYNRGSLLEYKTYRLTKKYSTVEFREDGTVYYKHTKDSKVLAAPKHATDVGDIYDSYDGEYDSFSVTVDFDGTAYVKIGGSECKITVDENNMPKRILDYHGMSLGNITSD